MSKKKGRPSRLSNRVIAKTEELAGLGLTEEQIALVLGVSPFTITRWKSNTAFCASLKEGRYKADERVKHSLYHRALGYEYKEITREPRVIITYDKNGRKTQETISSQIVVTKIITKKALPDITAIIFWLKNRDRENWRDVKKEDHLHINGASFIQRLHQLAENGKEKSERSPNIVESVER